MNQKREGYLDYAKGIGLLLVIVGHSISNEIRDNYTVAHNLYDGIYFFHMQFMVFVSGSTFAISLSKRKNMLFTEYSLSRVISYILPYISYSVTVYAIFMLTKLVPSLARIIANTNFSSSSSFLYGILTASSQLTLHLWYLYVLFFMTVGSFAIFRLCKGKQDKIFKVIILLLAVVFYIFRPSKLFDLWFGVFALMEVYLWFCLGVIFDIKKVKPSHLLSILVVIFLFKFAKIDNHWLVLLIGILERLVIILVMIKICEMIDKNKLLLPIKKIGENSMVYYVFHQPFCASVVSVLMFKLLKNNWVIPVVCAFVMSLLVPSVINYILDRFDLRVLKMLYLGRKKG